MPTPVKPVPDGYHSVTPYLTLRNASEAIAYYKKAFGATEQVRMDMPGGKVGHAELRIGDSLIMLSDHFPEMPDSVCKDPKALGGTTIGLHIYLDQVDVRFEQAVKAGGKILRPLNDKFYGDRSGTLEDPFGHIWTLSTHVEDVSPEEMERRMKENPKG